MDSSQVVENSPMLLYRVASFMNDGGIFMWIILGVWCIGVAIALERIKKYQTFSTNGASFLDTIKKYVLANEVQKAIQMCTESKSLLAFVLKNGLKRATQSKEQIEDSMLGAMLEISPKVEDRLSYIALAANLSTLLGLLGTIQGLIQSFAAVANAEAGEKGRLLAEGIAVAMNTTALGLISAIMLMVLHTILLNKGEKLVKEIEEKAVKLTDLLSTRKVASSEV